MQVVEGYEVAATGVLVAGGGWGDGSEETDAALVAGEGETHGVVAFAVLLGEKGRIEEE